ncbi:MAG: COG4223 family protein [Paracoccaceae bacterium]
MTRRKDPQPETETPLAEPVVIDEPVIAEQVEPATQDVVAEDPVASPSPVDPLPPPAPPPARSSGLLAPLFGGALAALGGFALSHFNLLGPAASDQGAELAAISAQITKAQEDQAKALDGITGNIAALSNRLDTLEAKPAPELPDLSGLDALDTRLAAIEAMPLDATGANPALAAKVAELERRLAALPATDTSAAVQNQLDEALARLDAAEAAAKTQVAEAEAAAAKSRRSQALDALSRAVIEGRPFAAELQALEDPALSSTLGPLAETGVPTLANLQAEFPDGAREALRLARDMNPEAGWTDRLVDFLAVQTGARSVTPRDGTTPDAILSRAEFALSEGRVADALVELAPLEDAVKAPLAAWVAAASNHVAAVAAVQAAGGE